MLLHMGGKKLGATYSSKNVDERRSETHNKKQNELLLIHLYGGVMYFKLCLGVVILSFLD